MNNKLNTITHTASFTIGFLKTLLYVMALITIISIQSISQTREPVSDGTGAGNITAGDDHIKNSVNENKTSSAKNISLTLVNPNTLNSFTTIKFQVAKQENVKLIIVNELQQEVITLANKQFNPGSYEIKLDASDLGTGEYSCKISTPSYSEIQKMMPVK